MDVSEAETSPEGVYVLIKNEGSKYVSTRVLSKADGPSLKREIEWVKERCLNGKRELTVFIAASFYVSIR